MRSSPPTIASCSSDVSTPMACSIAAWASEPAMSPGRRRRSTSMPAVYSSTAGDVSSPRRPAQTFGASSAIAATARAPFHFEWRLVIKRALHASLRAQRQAEQLDESACGGVVEAVVRPVVGSQIGFVQRARRLAPDHAGIAAAGTPAHGSGDVHLGGGHERVQRYTQRANPEAVGHQAGPLVGDALLELLHV